MWWQSLIALAGLVFVIFGMLSAFWLGGKLARGESLRKPKPPKPILDDAQTRNEKLKRAQESARERFLNLKEER